MAVSDFLDTRHCRSSGILVDLNMNEPMLHNHQLAQIFHLIAAYYRYLGTEQRFRAIAYDNASRIISGLKEDISVYAKDVKSLDKISGIGESIAEKIIEYLRTGKIGLYEQLKVQVPSSLLEIMDITGFGPATVKRLHEKLGISTREELVKALEAGKLKGQKGFGAKKIENLMRGLKLYKTAQERMLLPEALKLGNGLVDRIKPLQGVIKIELAGSLRRMKETIGDIDIVVAAKKQDWTQITKKILHLGEVGRILASGETKCSFLLKDRGIQVDIRLVTEHEYGAALMYFTGSKEHSVKLRTWAKSRNWKLSEYGLFDAHTNKRLAGTTEQEIYEWFDMQFIPPELREANEEIEVARKYQLPKLIEITDIKGDLQMHSKWSDGAEKILTIANYILKEFPQYEYIVITDHSPSERVAGGLQVKDFIKQFAEIDAINEKLGKTFIKKGVEVDILSDGSLDLPNDLLQQFDWVTASIHTGFIKDNTERFIKACEHPYVHCLSHPGGRIIGKRNSYPVNWKLLFKTLKETGTAIEINSQPDRLDLNASLVKEAIKEGVMITISTDAHMLSQFNYMTLGVSVARRSWCSIKNVLNAHSWKAIEKFKKHRNQLHQIDIA